MAESGLNATPQFNGLLIGVGGTYTHSIGNNNSNVTLISTTTPTTTYNLGEATSSGLNPAANIVYLFHLKQEWYLGGKLFYKYIDTRQFSQSWTCAMDDLFRIPRAREKGDISTLLKNDISKLPLQVKFGRIKGSQNKTTPAKQEKIRIFLQAGQSYDWIAKELSVSKKTIAEVKKSLKKL